jgi:DNA-binding HxlR family transcriptional regulator
MANVQDELTAGLDAALARIGDRWSLLVVGALLGGPLRFNQLQEALGGIATNVLSQRLKSLEGLGLIVATPYSHRPPRYAYGLTAPGEELAGAVRLLTKWGAEQAGGLDDGPVHAECGTPLEAHWYCPTCSRVLTDEELEDPGFV